MEKKREVREQYQLSPIRKDNVTTTGTSIPSTNQYCTVQTGLRKPQEHIKKNRRI